MEDPEGGERVQRAMFEKRGDGGRRECVQSKQDDPSTDGSATKKLETLSDAGELEMEMTRKARR